MLRQAWQPRTEGFAIINQACKTLSFTSRRRQTWTQSTFCFTHWDDSFDLTTRVQFYVCPADFGWFGFFHWAMSHSKLGAKFKYVLNLFQHSVNFALLDFLLLYSINFHKGS